jgi:hypothetical protein
MNTRNLNKSHSCKQAFRAVDVKTYISAAKCYETTVFLSAMGSGACSLE